MRLAPVGGGRLPLFSLGGKPTASGPGWSLAIQPARSALPRATPPINSALRGPVSDSAGDRLLSRLRSLVAQAPALGPAASAPAAASFASVVAVPATRSFSIAHETTRTTVMGANREQVAGADFGRLLPGERVTVEGEVTRRAEAATLTIRGGAGGVATAGGPLQLTGNRGSAAFAVSRNESLAALAARINEQVAVTGIEAAVAGDDLVLSSIDRGSTAFVDVEALGTDYQTDIQGVNPAQVTQFGVSSFAVGGTETLTGRLESAAQGAELVYHGASGSIAGTASFRLTGERGAVDITLASGELLAAAAERINEATIATGVIATVDGDDLRLTSDTVGVAARVEISAIERAHNTVVSGVNSSQIEDVQVTSIETGSQHELTGTVTRTASAAELTLQGSAGGTVIDTATFELRGSVGTATLDITAGESLAAVAVRVNALADTTGVSAAVVGDQLRFSSSDIGSSARLEVALLHVAHETSVSGVNSQQLAAFQANQFLEGAAQTLSGSVTQTATQAQLTFSGNFLSLVGSNATIRVNGSLGSAQLSVTSFQSVSSLATQVNQHTQTTGVAATVQGNKVLFRSTGVGTSAVVDIDVLSGSFKVSGGNGQGTATGTNAVAVINGQTIAGAGNDFQYSDAVGTYAFVTVSGFTGALSPVSIVSRAGSFELTGGNGDGTADGLDGLATINGVELTGVRNRYDIDQPGGRFEVEFTGGFVGQFDSVTVASVPESFDVTGGDGAGRAAGSDARAIFNGIEYTSADGQFLVQGTQGTYVVEFASGFTGEFDPITIESTPRLLEIDGSDGAGRDAGEDAQATINGVSLAGAGSTFRFVADGREVTVGFAPDFAGQFDRIEAFGERSTVFEVVPQRASAAAARDSDFDQFPAASALETAVSELNALIAEAGNLPERSDLQELPEAADPELATRTAIIREQFAVYARQRPELTASAAELPTLGKVQQLRNLVDLLA